MAEQVYKDYHLARQKYKVIPDPECKDPNDIVEYAWKQKVKKLAMVKMILLSMKKLKKFLVLIVKLLL